MFLKIVFIFTFFMDCLRELGVKGNYYILVTVILPMTMKEFEMLWRNKVVTTHKRSKKCII